MSTGRLEAILISHPGDGVDFSIVARVRVAAACNDSRSFRRDLLVADGLVAFDSVGALKSVHKWMNVSWLLSMANEVKLPKSDGTVGSEVFGLAEDGHRFFVEFSRSCDSNSHQSRQKQLKLNWMKWNFWNCWKCWSNYQFHFVSVTGRGPDVSSGQVMFDYWFSASTCLIYCR